MSLFVFFISLLIVAQHVSGNHVPIIRSWRLRDVIASCWYVPWLQALRASCATNPSMDALPANRTWQPACSHGTYQHEVITSRSRQLLVVGTWLPETCWAIIRREMKNTKVKSSWFFLSTLNYDARSTTHQIYNTVLWLLELQIRRGRKVQTQIRTVNSSSRTSNCQCNILLNKNPIIRTLCTSG